MEVIIILLLILLNGFFALSEMALVSMRKQKMEAQAKKGDKKAKRALKIAGNIDNFLSSIQIGITGIGLLTGIFSGKSIALWLNSLLISLSIPESTAYTISVIIIVIVITFLTLVLGEIVPKRIALSDPEKYSREVSGAMEIISKIGFPFVFLISAATEAIIKALHIQQNAKSKVTEDEIRAIIQEGTKNGEIEEVEQDIVERVFNLSDREVQSIMTHRNDLDWIDLEDSIEKTKKFLKKNVHSVYPVSTEHLDTISGVVFLKDFFTEYNTEDFNITKYLKPAQFVPETMNCYSVLELFKKTQQFYAVVTDEFGSIQGIVTINDITGAMIGTIIEPDETDEQIIERHDGSFLVDGQYSFYDFLAYFDMEDLYQEHDYNTLSGLILDLLEHIPSASERLVWKNFDMEIMDMDGARIDKVLVKFTPPEIIYKNDDETDEDDGK